MSEKALDKTETEAAQWDQVSADEREEERADELCEKKIAGVRVVERPVSGERGKQRAEKRGHDAGESETRVDQRHECGGRAGCGFESHDGFHTMLCEGF